MGGLFVKKVESVGVFGKKVDLSSTQSALCTVSVFFCFAFYLLRGAYAPNTPHTGLNTQMVIASASELCQLSCQHDQACFVCCGVCKIK